MKKLLLTTLIAGALAGSAFAQGTVSLQASSAGHGLIQYQTAGGTTNAFPTGSPATIGTYGNLDVAVYYASANTADPITSSTASLLPTGSTGWTESANVLHQIAPTAGSTPLTTFTLTSDAGADSQEVMVLAWTGTYADWNSALQASSSLYAWTGRFGIGGLDWSNGTGAPNGTPPVAPVALTYSATAGFDGLVLESIPEPTSFALAGLGLATLLIFRRRK
jgi:hypothetical protein